MVSYFFALVVVKGLWKLEPLLLTASPDCSRRCCELVEAETEAVAARRDDGVTEVGSVCRVQLRTAEPADAGTGRIVKAVRVEIDRGRRGAKLKERGRRSQAILLCPLCSLDQAAGG